MSTELWEPFQRLLERVLAYARDDAELRLSLHDFAVKLAEITGRGEPAQTAEAASHARAPSSAIQPVIAQNTAAGTGETIAASAPGPSLPPQDVLSAGEAVSRLTLGRTTPGSDEPQTGVHVESADYVRTGPWKHVPDEELPLIEQRCRVKAQAVQWSLERAQLLAANADFATAVEPRDKEMVRTAKALPDCYLWTIFHEQPTTATEFHYQILAGAYETLGDAERVLLEAMASADEVPEMLQEALQLTAEAQSALRAAVRGVNGQNDADQEKAYNWLWRTAAEQHIFIARHMRAGDPADPGQWPDLQQRLHALDAKFEGRRTRQKQRRKLLGHLKYVAGQLQEDAGEAYQWAKLLGIVNELVDMGEPPSSREIRGYLLSVLNDLPEFDEELPTNVSLVLREIDAYLANRPDEEPAAQAPAPTAEVREVARLLAGHSMMLIGGERRRPQEESLKHAFGLDDLIWIATREHESLDKFEPHVANPDVVVVLLAIRWSSHSYGEVKTFCDQHDKPLVRLPAGYNPNQVAAQILAQCSDRLQPVRS